MEKSRPITYTFEDIKRYKQGLMNREEMHAFEKASMEDPFLADALEGYMNADNALAEEHLSNIKERITHKEEQKEKAVVVAMPQKRFGFMRVAAMIIVIAGAGLLTYKVLDKQESPSGEPIAESKKQASTINKGENQQAAAPSTSIDSSKTSVASSKTNNGSDNYRNALPDKNDGSIAKVENERPVDQIVTGNSGEIKAQADDKTKENSNKPAKPIVPVLEKVVTEDVVTTNAGYARNQVQNNQITGRVVGTNNQPLSNANIRLDNSKKLITTDQEGAFSLNSTDSVVVATVETPGFLNNRVELRSNATNTINLGSITLHPDPSFNEIAVTGLGTLKKKERVADTLTSKPEGGWESFQQYVANKLNIKLDTTGRDMKISGELELEFFVDANGIPKDFKILNSTDPSLNQEAIEAVKKGPKWATRKKKARILIRY
jgi:hypothetical protein